MYLKVRVQSPYVSTERYYCYEVCDDFMELTENERDREMVEAEQDAISEYIYDVSTEVCEGNFEEDEDY